MRIRVSALEFKRSLEKLIQSTAKTCINFTEEDGKLFMQASVGVIIEREVSCIDTEGNPISISVAIDRGVIPLIKDTSQKFVTLTQAGSLLFIQQGEMQVILSEQPEDRIHLFDVAESEYKQVRVSEFKKILHVSRAMSPMVKALAASESPVMILGGNAYVTYSNTAYIVETKLPDMQVSYDLLKKAVNAITEDTVNYLLDKEDGVLWLRTKECRISIPVAEVYEGSVEQITSVESSLKDLTQLSITAYTEDIKTLCNIKKAGMCYVFIGGGSLHLNVENNTTRFEVGPEVKDGVTLQLSMAQLAVIAALYGDCTEVKVRKGINLICMISENLKSRLLLAGLTYTE